ncbi:hypothetical protein ACQY0O_003299 [Thecaphora frezii]
MTAASALGGEALINGSSHHLERSENVLGYSDVSFSSTLTADSEAQESAPLNPGLKNSAANGRKDYPTGNAAAAEPAPPQEVRGWRAINDVGGGGRIGTSVATSVKSPVSDDPLTPRAPDAPSLPDRGGSNGVVARRGSYANPPSTLSPSTHIRHQSVPTGLSGKLSINIHKRLPVESPFSRDALYDREPAEAYTSTADEDAEAKRVQQNLERWAAEERNRRKAARTSRTSLGPPSAGSNGLVRRFSGLRSASRLSGAGLGAGPSSERLADGAPTSPSAVHSPINSRFGRRDSSPSTFLRGASRPDSLSSMDSSNTQDELIRSSMGTEPGSAGRYSGSAGPRITSFGNLGIGDSVALEDVPESESESSYKGKERAAANPFEDPSEASGGGYQHSSVAAASTKPLPTALRPIVTVGRASSIQRRTIEAAMLDCGKGKRRMPSIVATDTDAGVTGEGDGAPLSGSSDNPFASEEDGRYTNGGVGTGRIGGGVSTTLHHGGLDEEVAMELQGRRNLYSMASSGRYSGDGQSGQRDVGRIAEDDKFSHVPSRVSTSSSKFRELGITAGDDWMGTVEAADKRARAPRPGQLERERKPWWTDWLCGCVSADEDEEQAGRTNPME